MYEKNISSETLVKTTIKEWRRPVFALVLGVGMLAGGLLLGGHNWNYVSHAGRADGVVIENQEHLGYSRSSHRRLIFYRPVFEFYDANGAVHRAVEKSGSRPPMWSVGDKVGVLYDKKNPDLARIDSWKTIWMWPVVLVVCGAVFSGVGVWVLLCRGLF